VSSWPRYPTIFEINTWVWLSGLGEKFGKSFDLGSVLSAEWDAIANYGFDAVWLMGVWERSPAGIAIANQNKNLLDDFQRALLGLCHNSRHVMSTSNPPARASRASDYRPSGR
jgi:hypothetical protein